MLKYALNHANIDAVSGQVTAFLAAEGVSEKDVLRTRLSVEEILLKYHEYFGENKSFALLMSRRLSTLRIEVKIAGESIDPFALEEESGESILNRLLANYGLAPAWRYRNGKNIITFTAKKQKTPSQVVQLGIAIVSALVLGGICKLLPAQISAFITAGVITPVFNTFMGLMSAIAGPIIFLSVVWGICGMGDMGIFGRIGKRMIGRFMSDSVIIGAAGTALCALFFKISSSGTMAFSFSDLYQMVLDIVPGNFVAPFVEGTPCRSSSWLLSWA